MADDTRDRHVRRQGSDYAIAMLQLLPQGQAWPRGLDCATDDSTLVGTIRGLADYYGFVDSRAADLLERESDPRITIELLSDWERAWGLPEKCLATPQTIGERQVALVTKMTLLGAQSRQFFIDLAAKIGYDIKIQEFAPWMFGVSQCGRTDDGTVNHYWRWEIGPPEMRFFWTVKVSGVKYIWWRYGLALLGIDPHLRIGVPRDLECILRRLKPAHTEIVFDFREVGWHDFSPAPIAIKITSDTQVARVPTMPASTQLVFGFATPTVTIADRFFKFPQSATLFITTNPPGPATSFQAAVPTIRVDIFGTIPDVSRTKQINSGALQFFSDAPTRSVAANLVPGSQLVQFTADIPTAYKSALIYRDSTYILFQDGTRVLLR